ncbi:hypothetical protein E2C01_040660 [Portunus trituberculatus]|uniref:Uncharacterized protein n=1 Tax=Portunus trituberculatus TaxID=210409 RepID=A0A5B7FPT6_PORTR|nr:hypothetical protein [Portunus trituberculatus]
MYRFITKLEKEGEVEVEEEEEEEEEEQEEEEVIPLSSSPFRARVGAGRGSWEAGRGTVPRELLMRKGRTTCPLSAIEGRLAR